MSNLAEENTSSESCIVVYLFFSEFGDLKFGDLKFGELKFG